MIEIGYRAFSADSGYAATARLHESVRAGVRLAVNPRRTSSEGTITLTGRVLGPIPSQGVVVELLVHYRGRCKPSRDPRTDGRGRFRVAYQFQGGVRRFPFRALVFGSQGGFPFALGESRTVMSPRAEMTLLAAAERIPRLLRRFALLSLTAGTLALTLASGASAGTYVIDNCPSTGSDDAGSWTVFGGPRT